MKPPSTGTGSAPLKKGNDGTLVHAFWLSFSRGGGGRKLKKKRVRQPPPTSHTSLLKNSATRLQPTCLSIRCRGGGRGSQGRKLTPCVRDGRCARTPPSARAGMSLCVESTPFTPPPAPPGRRPPSRTVQRCHFFGVWGRVDRFLNTLLGSDVAARCTRQRISVCQLPPPRRFCRCCRRPPR